jgi:hypothetical protein
LANGIRASIKTQVPGLKPQIPEGIVGQDLVFEIWDLGLGAAMNSVINPIQNITKYSTGS